MRSLKNKLNASCVSCKLAYHSTTSNRGHIAKMCTQMNEHAMNSGTPTKQPRLDSHLSPPATSSACTKKLASFICKDIRPISIVDGTGFREFCQELEPKYCIPKIPIQVVMSCISLSSCYWHNANVDIWKVWTYVFFLEWIFERHFGAILTALQHIVEFRVWQKTLSCVWWQTVLM